MDTFDRIIYSATLCGVSATVTGYIMTILSLGY